MRSLAFMNIGGQELLLILLLVLVFFGAKKLPALARGMGKAVNEFQKARDDFNAELHAGDKPDLQTKAAPSTVPRTEDESIAAPRVAQAHQPTESDRRA